MNVGDVVVVVAPFGNETRRFVTTVEQKINHLGTIAEEGQAVAYSQFLIVPEDEPEADPTAVAEQSLRLA